MSRWLNQVNSLLERLDGQVEAVASDDTGTAASASASVVGGGSSVLLLQSVAQAAVAAVSAPRRQYRSRQTTTNGADESGELTSSDEDYRDDDEEDDYEDEEDEDYEYAGESNDGDDEFEDEDLPLENDPANSDPSHVELVMKMITPDEILVGDSARLDPVDFLNHPAGVVVVDGDVNVDRVDDITDTGVAPPRTVTTAHGGGSNDASLSTPTSVPESSTLPSSSSLAVGVVETLPDMSTNVATQQPTTTTTNLAREAFTADEHIPESQSLDSIPLAPSVSTRQNTNHESSPAQPETETTVTDVSPSSGGGGNSNSNSIIKALNRQIQQLEQHHAYERANQEAKIKASMQHIRAQNESEISTLRRRNEQYQSDATILRRELDAVNDELQQAAVTVERERVAAKEEHDELLYEQEEELQQLKKEYEGQIQRLRSDMQQQKTQFQAQWTETKRERRLVDGDLTAKLQHALEQEKNANQSIQSLEELNSQLQLTVNDTQEKLTGAIQQTMEMRQRLQTAEQASATAEERLDTLIDQHKNQLQQRLLREAALEQTVAELSRVAAVASAGVAMDTPTQNTIMNERDRLSAQVAEYKDRLQNVQEELDTRQSDLILSNDRCQALQQELADLSRERHVETTAMQASQRHLEARLQAVTQSHQRFIEQTEGKDSNMPNAQGLNNTDHLSRELDVSKQHATSLSDQLRRQQGVTETFKSEILALKGRLQAVTTRAEAAERQQEMLTEVELGHSSNPSLIDRGSTGSNQRRRVKGGRLGPLSTRTMRGALGWHKNMTSPRGSGQFKQQLGDTMDALDHWMIETGGVLRHEPLARLAFAAYLVMIHLWCFGLVMFHTIEAEHGDLGYLTDRSNRLGSTSHA